MKKCYLNSMGILCSAGDSIQALKTSLINQKPSLTHSSEYCLDNESVPLGIFNGELPAIALEDNQWQSRNNQFALKALQQIQTSAQTAIDKYGSERVGVIIGTSTSGIAESETMFKELNLTGLVLTNYDYKAQEMAATANFLAKVLEIRGPSYSISTACSSGAKALASAKRLIQSGICDAVIAGGVDTLCNLTVQGFQSLESVSRKQCNPFSRNRDGINIGEGGALFLVTSEPKGVELCGVGESSDAHHISAPDPTGKGAINCITAALHDAEIEPKTIDYINLHGTATPLNDYMESIAIHTIFGSHVYCSSTKPFVGHALGAAGALEAGICALALGIEGECFFPVHLWDEIQDDELPKLNLVQKNQIHYKSIKYVLSNSFAFGGNNISLILKQV